MGAFNKAIVAPDQAITGKTARGDDVVIIARSRDTDGQLGIWSNVIKPGTGPNWHSHGRDTEVFHVLSGQFRFWCGDEVFDLGEGGTIVLPPTVSHQWKNIGSTAGRLLAFVTPGGFEQNFIDLASLGRNATEEEALAIEARLGVTAGRSVGR